MSPGLIVTSRLPSRTSAPFATASVPSSPATKIEDTLKIERELSRVQTELDQMKASMKSMQSKVAHSTFDLSINRDRITGPLGAVKDGTGWVFDKLFYLN